MLSDQGANPHRHIDRILRFAARSTLAKVQRTTDEQRDDMKPPLRLARVQNHPTNNAR